MLAVFSLIIGLEPSAFYTLVIQIPAGIHEKGSKCGRILDDEDF